MQLDLPKRSKSLTYPLSSCHGSMFALKKTRLFVIGKQLEWEKRYVDVLLLEEKLL